MTTENLESVKQDAIAAKYGEFKTRTAKSKVSRGDSFFQGLSDGRQVNVSQHPLTSTVTVRLA